MPSLVSTHFHPIIAIIFAFVSGQFRCPSYHLLDAPGIRPFRNVWRRPVAKFAPAINTPDTFRHEIARSPWLIIDPRKVCLILTNDCRALISNWKTYAQCTELQIPFVFDRFMGAHTFKFHYRSQFPLHPPCVHLILHRACLAEIQKYA